MAVGGVSQKPQQVLHALLSPPMRHCGRQRVIRLCLRHPTRQLSGPDVGGRAEDHLEGRGADCAQGVHPSQPLYWYVAGQCDRL